MGIFRLILSIEIVIFHSCTMLGIIGYSAVFGFYLMSGYAIMLVLDQKYENRLGKFWLNRWLKLYPAYAAVFAASMLLYVLCGNEVVIAAQKEKLFVAALDSYSFQEICRELFLGYQCKGHVSTALLLNGFPTITTQAWTHSVNLFFYLTAPLLIKLWKRNKLYYVGLFLLSLVYPLFTYMAGLDFPTYRYRSVFGSYFIFMTGGFLYFLKDKFPDVKYKGMLFVLLNVFYLSLFAFGSGKHELTERKIWFSVIIEVCILIVATQKTEWGGVKLQRACASFSAGIYIVQKLARAMIMAVCSISPVFADWLGWGTDFVIVPMLLVSAMLAIVLYVFIDRPLGKIRDTGRRT